MNSPIYNRHNLNKCIRVVNSAINKLPTNNPNCYHEAFGISYTDFRDPEAMINEDPPGTCTTQIQLLVIQLFKLFTLNEIEMVICNSVVLFFVLFFAELHFKFLIRENNNNNNN